MTHPENLRLRNDPYTSPRLADMRRVLDEDRLSDRERRLAERAISEIEAEWHGKQRAQYEQGLAARDRLHDQVIKVAGLFREQLAEAMDDVRHGRRSAQEVRAWLRDVRERHSRLTQQHQGIEASEDRLAEREAMDVADYQAEQLSRFPLIRQTVPTLGVKMTELARERRLPAVRRRTKAQLDEEQDAVAAGLATDPDWHRPAPPRRSAGRVHG